LLGHTSARLEACPDTDRSQMRAGSAPLSADALDFM
jgi:hypothetical protein